MPYCRTCGNRRFFGASAVSPAAPTANGPASGLMGDFDDAGELVTITRMGADKSLATRAGAQPDEYFDFCLVCGGNDVEWRE